MNNPQSRTSQVKALHATLRQKYRVIQSHQPLAVGIADEVVSLGYPEDVVRRVLQQHVTATVYLKALVKGGKRFHLDGTEAGDVAEEHSKYAQEKLDTRMADFAQKKAEADEKKKQQEEAIAAAKATAKAAKEKAKQEKITSKPVVPTPVRQTPEAQTTSPKAPPTVVVKKRRSLSP